MEEMMDRIKTPNLKEVRRNLWKENYTLMRETCWNTIFGAEILEILSEFYTRSDLLQNIKEIYPGISCRERIR